jgi:very-short-patch-repair endonuclease
MTAPPSRWEAMLAMHIRAHRLPEPVREYCFHPTRNWRLDFAWPELFVAVEVEGGVFARRKGNSAAGGRHNHGGGYVKDLEKYNAAVAMGWTLLRFTDKAIRRGDAVRMIQEALRRSNERRSNERLVVLASREE